MFRDSIVWIRWRKEFIVTVFFFFSWAPNCRQIPRITDLCAFQSVVGLETEPVLVSKKEEISDQICSRVSGTLRSVAFKHHKVCLAIGGMIW